ncbi:urease accessory protein [Anoxybacillus tepidamans]|uniref:Urease accessory protein UreF n=1 Tax=Anoxybacteroides tepidamans TaxID=265948 RepID=A0A7W8IPA0_9BACL|nr:MULTISPECIES: urease accessory protein UreF [Anoxybacillus]MBB5323199.1 urease accessory protein [Anoxybacillus tepidamans]MCZ0756267.1 urease accessory protein UreF [Anoxybacillus sp. J5B_2022]
MLDKLLPLLQLCDSNFPSGAFSHSFGFETYIYNEKINNEKTFREALCAYIRTQLTYIDGLACRLTYDFLQKQSKDDVWRLNEILAALCLARETREGTRMIGERMWKLCREIYPFEIWNDDKEKRDYIHPAIVFAIVCDHLEIPKDITVLSYLYTSVQTLVQNAVRGIPLGQTDGQKLLVFVQPYLIEAVQTIDALTEEDLGAVTPGLEIAQMQHEQLSVRLFMS